MNKQKLFWWFFWLFNWLVIFSFWFLTGGFEFSSLTESFIHLGGLFGLMAAFMILTQFFLMGRNLWLEKTFGLDKLSRFHHLNGKYSLIFLLAHPLFIVSGYSLAAEISFLNQLKFFAFGNDETLKALIALFLFVFVVLSSLIVSLRKLRYELWYFIHLAVYLAVLLSFSHQFEFGYSLTGSSLFYGYWVLLYLLVLFNHLKFRFLRPLLNFYRHGFKVGRIIRENYNVVSIYISGKNLESFRVLPGQFMIFRFLAPEFFWESHPFSLSKPMNGLELRITPKEVGDFTKKLQNLPLGAKVIIEGPFGVFTDNEKVSDKILLIAGGIGITPLRSLAQAMVQKGKDVILLFGNKTRQDIVFENEFKDITGLKLINVLSDEKNYSGETGYIDKEKIQRLVPDFLEREVFLCGPEPMMDSVISDLKELDFPSAKLHFEKFSL